MLHCSNSDATADLDAASLVLLDAGPLLVPALPLDEITPGPTSRTNGGTRADPGTTHLN
jgi:hypothetical protein